MTTAEQILSPNHWTVPNFSQRVTKKDLRTLLLQDDFYFIHGRRHALKHCSLGAGVHDIWMEIRE